MATKIQGITIEIGGDASPLARALSSLNKSINSTQSELKAVDKALKLNPDSVVLLTQKQKLLEDQIKNTSAKFDSLKQIEQELQSRREADPSNENLEKQLRAVQRELSNTEAGLKGLEGAYSETGKQAENVSVGSTNMAESVGKSATEINAKIEIFNRFAEAVAKVAEKLFSFITDSAEKADDFNILSAKTGIATDELQKLTYAAQFVDVSVDTMTGSISKLINNMDSAKNGTGTAAEAFQKLRINVTDAHGQLRDGNTVFLEAIDKLGKISNETERDAIAMDLFGKSARELNPLILEGSARLKELGAEAENAGIIMSQDTLDGAANFNDTMDRLRLTLEGIATSIGAELADSLTELLEAITPIILAIAKLISLIAGIPAPVLYIIAIIITLVTTFAQVTKGISAAKGMIDLMNPSMWKTVGIIMAIVTALIAVLALIVAISGKKDDLTGIGKSIGQITDSVGVKDIPQYAHGTNYHRGGAAYITEYAPEQLSLPSGTNMVVMPRGTKVTPNVSVGAGGGDVFNISINARDVREFNDIVRLAEGARQQRRAK